MKTNQFQLGQAQAKAEREKSYKQEEDNFRKTVGRFCASFCDGDDQKDITLSFKKNTTI